MDEFVSLTRKWKLGLNLYKETIFVCFNVQHNIILVNKKYT